MFCNNCGKEMPNDANVCPNCGKPVEGSDVVLDAEVKTQPAKKSNVLVVSIILCVVGSVASLFIPLIGYACGAGCVGAGTKAKKDGDSKALVAIILGVVCIVISLASQIIGAILLAKQQ